MADDVPIVAADDDQLAKRRIQAIPLQKAPVEPTPPVVAMPASSAPVLPAPQTARPELVNKSGQAIPIGRHAAIPGYVNPDTNGEPGLFTPPHPVGVAELASKAENIHNPFLRALGKVGAYGARALDTAGTILTPGAAAAIPGTTMNQAVKIGGARKLEAEQTKEGLEKAQTKEANATADEREKQGPKLGQPEEQAFAYLLTQTDPKTNKPYTPMAAFSAAQQAKQDVKPESDQAKTVTTDKGVMQFNPETKKYDIPVGGAPEKKPDTIDQQYDEAVKSGDIEGAKRLLKIKGDLAAAGQQPQRPPQQLAVGPDGKVIELKPGVTVPQGTKTVSGELGAKATADEQKRADLAENLNENFNQLEDILTRRPDLFGKVAGRLTNIREWIGSDDKDIAALGTLKHQIGMAQISAHGMRSAQGVESAAESLVNSWKNGADATKSALEKARTSVKTFEGDVEKAKSGGESSGSSAGSKGVWDPVKGQYVSGGK